MPSSTVSHMKTIVWLRWLARIAWWAMVTVTPEESSSAVLIVGSQNGVIVWKGSTMLAGDAVAPAASEGHTALKSGHSTALSTPPSAGTECERIHHRAVKNAPKNITSEKMNQLMLQRKEISTLWPYMPVSLSWIASRNHWNSTVNSHRKPTASENFAQSAPLIHSAALAMMISRPAAAIAGWREGAGT